MKAGANAETGYRKALIDHTDTITVARLTRLNSQRPAPALKLCVTIVMMVIAEHMTPAPPAIRATQLPAV